MEDLKLLDEFELQTNSLRAIFLKTEAKFVTYCELYNFFNNNPSFQHVFVRQRRFLMSSLYDSVVLGYVNFFDTDKKALSLCSCRKKLNKYCQTINKKDNSENYKRLMLINKTVKNHIDAFISTETYTAFKTVRDKHVAHTDYDAENDFISFNQINEIHDEIFDILSIFSTAIGLDGFMEIPNPYLDN